ncbi:GNAT family N-acetyltransferase [Lecanosticta acicola]|uniref:GNAT family N-acetyltransferase n=1 Tax=Lecanosticta acicola TaxID=111012 RepID=A0AAI9E974_9PEZI|nr:GNAT family N-acetyltransferase [Lecanosticta acicola]
MSMLGMESPASALNCTIRQRRDSDIESCVSVLGRVQKQDGYPVAVADFRAFLTPKTLEQAWVAEHNGQIVGHISVSAAQVGDVAVDLWRRRHPDDHIAALQRLFLAPEYRGCGLASKLIENAVHWSHQKGYRHLVLYALRKDLKAARLYDRLGWEHFDTGMFAYGDGQEMEALCFSSPGPR